MISIVICSRDKKQLSDVIHSIEITIGVPYEVVAIDNTTGQYSICEAYNLGASKSKYDFLCFAHEDLAFHTQDWGKVLLKIFKEKTIGAVGVAGSKYLPDTPSPWWGAGYDYNRINVLQTSPEKPKDLYYINQENELLTDVVALDGLWIATRKEAWQKFPFDSKTLTDFHCYDVDYCLGLYGAYRVCLTYEILIEHFSHGSLNSSWIKNAFKLYEKHKSRLPISTVLVSTEEKRKIRAEALEFMINTMRNNNYDKKAIKKNVFQWLLNAQMTRDNFWKLRFFLGLTK